MATRSSTRTKLLDATDELLFSRGIVHTPVDRILELAGVSPATLYRAYRSKEGLVTAALERRHDDWLAVWDDAVARAEDDRGRLLAVLEALELFRRRPDRARWCAFLGTAAEYADPPPELVEALRVESEALRERLTRLAEPVAGEHAGALAEALMVVVSGRLAMSLRPGAADAAGSARVVAELLVDHPERLA